jgi:hypothetical protein
MADQRCYSIKAKKAPGFTKPAMIHKVMQILEAHHFRLPVCRFVLDLFERSVLRRIVLEEEDEEVDEDEDGGGEEEDGSGSESESESEADSNDDDNDGDDDGDDDDDDDSSDDSESIVGPQVGASGVP